MPSRAELERSLRVVALAALMLAVLVVIRLLRARSEVVVEGAAQVRSGLRAWTLAPPMGRLRLHLDTLPDGTMRDWLAALAATGSVVTWAAAPPVLSPTGIAAEPLADPRRPVRVSVAASPGSRWAVSDRTGLLDSVRVGVSGGVKLIAGTLDGRTDLSGGPSRPSAVLHDSLSLRPVLVLGTGGWEAKFLIAALEERGWRVETRLGLAPGQAVTQGPASVTIDTSRIAAVVAVDASAGRFAAAIARFVETGGGLVVLNQAAILPGLTRLLPAAALGPESDGRSFGNDSTSPRAFLALRPLERLVPGAVVLELQGLHPAVAIRRAVGGRVVQVGYDNIWRWRMAARSDSTLVEQQRWWSSLVGAVAYTPRVPLLTPADSEAPDPAPVAALIAELGPPRPEGADHQAGLPDASWLPVLFGLALASLLGEWVSRRLRGTP